MVIKIKIIKIKEAKVLQLIIIKEKKKKIIIFNNLKMTLKLERVINLQKKVKLIIIISKIKVRVLLKAKITKNNILAQRNNVIKSN